MTRQRVKRKRLATGIYADSYGISIIVRGKEHRYPIGTPLEHLRRDRKELLDAAGTPAARRGTLDKAFDDYLDTIPEGPRRRDVTRMLQHWRDAGFGKLAVDAVKPIDIERQLAAWGAAFSAKTRKDLRWLLGAVYNVFNGRSGYNPVRDVKRITVRYDEPRGITYDLIDQLFTFIADRGRPTKGQRRPTVNLSKLRLRVMADTGWAPAMLKRVELRDFDPKAKTVFMRPRRKGRGVEGATLPLSDDAVRSLKALAKAQGFGPFSTRSVAYVWARALKKMRRAWEARQLGKRTPKPWPLAEDARPYDLRHSFGTLVLAETGDLEATARLLRHSTLQTTRRYIQAAAALRTQKAIAQLNRSRRAG
jgi:integrase